jgi:hypothetical protein
MGSLADVGFTRSTARGNGDCFVLSAMAGFEIPAAAAKEPATSTTAAVKEVRQAAIDLIGGVDPIDGIDAAVFREGERLPHDAADARVALRAWRSSGYWSSSGEDGNKSASFQLGVALHLGRSVAVIERRGEVYLNPARIYGARERDGSLIHSKSRPGAPETIPTFVLVPITDLLKVLRARPADYSLIEFNGSDHFIPWRYESGAPVADVQYTHERLVSFFVTHGFMDDLDVTSFDIVKTRILLRH